MKKTFIKFLPMMAVAMLATSCNNDDETINPSNGGDGVHTVSTPETTSIPFAIKVDTGKKLSKIGFKDDGTQVNISFTEKDVHNELKMQIYSNVQTFSIMPGEPGEPAFLGELTLQTTDGVFEGTLEFSYGMYPKKDEELFAIVEYDGFDENANLGEDDPYQPDTWFSNESLEDLMNKCKHQFKGYFNFPGTVTTTNKYGGEVPDPYTVDEDNALPHIQLTDQRTYFEITSNYLNSISLEKVYGSGKISQEYELPLWVVVDKEYIDQLNIIKDPDDQTDESLLYSKNTDDMDPGVIYSVDRSLPKN